MRRTEALRSVLTLKRSGKVSQSISRHMLAGSMLTIQYRPDPQNRLIPCEYTDKEGHLDLRPTVEKRFLRRAFTAASDLIVDVVARPFLGPFLGLVIYQTISSIKHGAYRSEQEWRCVNWCPDANDYPVRLSETNRLLYRDEIRSKEFIKEVWISPHGDKIGCESVVTYLKQEHDLCFEIKPSTIPFRG